MGVLTGEWENWFIKTKTKDGKVKTIPTQVYVVRRDKGRLVSWTKQENIKKLNNMIYEYEPESRDLPEGLYYQYHINLDVDSDAHTKNVHTHIQDDYEDIIDLRFSSKSKIPINRIMGRMIREINQLHVSPSNEGYKEGGKKVIQNFNWNTLRSSRNNYKLLRSIDVGVTTQPSSTEFRFKSKRVL
jgi:hypothetical protein